MKNHNAPLSRRRLFKKGAAAAASAALASQSGTVFGQGPAVVTARTFRGWISRGTGRGRTTLQELRLRPITGRQVVVRTEACNLCYSNVGAVLGIQPTPPAAGAATPANAGLTGANTNDMALIQGHGGVGVVEAVGPEVRRVQIGDRVCVSGTPQCGACYHCLRGRADVCQLLGRNLAGDLVPVADLRDGTPVYSNSHIGGLAVHIGERVCASAGPGEVLASRTVVDLVAGSGITFEDRGEHELKGVPDRWQLFAVTP